MPEHIGRGESSSWIKHGGCLRILVACNMMSVISNWLHEISYICFSPPARWGLLDFSRAVLLILHLLHLLLRLLLFLLLQFLLDHVCINFHVHFRLANSSPISSPTSARSGHCWTSTAGFRSEWARLDLNRQVLSAVGTAGPQPPGSERSGHCWTSTARLPSPVDRWTSTWDLQNLGPSELSVHRWTSTWDLSGHRWTSTAR